MSDADQIVRAMGDKLLLLRNHQRLTTRDVACAVGVSPSTVNRIENGKHPDLRSFVLLLNWLVENDD